MPKIVNRDKYKEELLLNSFDLFARRGYSAVKMREISREINVSTGTLYHYFQTKEQLFSEMVQLLANEDVEQLRLFQFRNRTKATTQDKRLELFFQFLTSKEFYFQNVILLVCDVFRYNHEEHRIGILKECADLYKKAISSQLGLKSKELETLFFSLVIGTIVQRMLNPEETTMENTYDSVRKIFPFLSSSMFFESTVESSANIDEQKEVEI